MNGCKPLALGGGEETGIVLVYPDCTLVVLEAGTRQVLEAGAFTRSHFRST